MANQKHSAFDITDSKVIRGGSVTGSDDLNSLSAILAGSGGTLETYDMSPFNLQIGDVFACTWQMSLTFTAGATISFTLEADDGTGFQTVGSIPAYTVPAGGTSSAWLTAHCHVVEDTSVPADDYLISSMTAYFNGTNTDVVTNLTTTATKLKGNDWQTVRLTYGSTGTGAGAVYASTVRVFGGSA